MLYVVVTTIVYIRGLEGQYEASLLIMGVILLPIMFPSVVAWFASWGFMESMAKDSRAGLSPSLVAFFYWLILLIVSVCFVFNVGIY